MTAHLHAQRSSSECSLLSISLSILAAFSGKVFFFYSGESQGIDVSSSAGARLPVPQGSCSGSVGTQHPAAGLCGCLGSLFWLWGGTRGLPSWGTAPVMCGVLCRGCGWVAGGCVPVPCPKKWHCRRQCRHQRQGEKSSNTSSFY